MKRTASKTLRRSAPTSGVPSVPKTIHEIMADGALLIAVLRGDERAWRELVRRHDHGVRLYVGRLLDGYAVASDAIEDVMGDFYLTLVAHDMWRLRIYNPSSVPLRIWLCLLATENAIHVLARMNARPRREQ